MLLLRSILVDFAFSGNRISAMDHKIIKTEFSMVELPKNTKKVKLWLLVHLFTFFCHFWTLRDRSSGKHYQKVKIFSKFEFSESDLPRKSKITRKKLFWSIFNFLLSFFDSLTYGFGFLTPPSIISSGRMRSQWIKHMLVHVLVTERQIDIHALKYQDSSKFKMVIFLAVFLGGFSTLTPPGHLTPNYHNIFLQT